MAEKKFVLTKFIIVHLVKQPLRKELWPKEMALAKKLTDKCNNESFWKSLEQMTLPSLAWLLTPKGKDFLNIEYKKFKLELKAAPVYNLESTKLGDDIQVVQKPKTLMDFLKDK